jgi:hypothetical protein
MLIKTYKPSSEVKVPYHINPYTIVGVGQLDGWYYVDTADGAMKRIDRDSYQRIVVWLEQAR